MTRQTRQTMDIESEIAGLKQLLAGTDYKALKHADGALSDAEYKETKEYRQQLRDKINELESTLMTVAESEDQEDAE